MEVQQSSGDPGLIIQSEMTVLLVKAYWQPYRNDKCNDARAITEVLWKMPGVILLGFIFLNQYSPDWQTCYQADTIQ